MFNYYMPTRFVFGDGALEKLHEQKLPGKKALVVISAGGSMVRDGYLKKLTDELDAADVAWTIFDKIMPNPIIQHVDEGAALAIAEGCDFVLGLGGGSSIDSAKSIAVAAANPGHSFWDFVHGTTGGGQKPENRPLPIVAVTTTAGTGTETDPWAVVQKNETHEKLGYGTDDTFPALSIVDPQLMATVPPHLTAFQGFDALYHVTECYINKNNNPISDILCIDAIKNIGKYLPKAVCDGGDAEARYGVALANTEAGFTQSISGCVSEHAIEHALSAYSQALPHGAGLIIISLAYYDVLIQKGACPERFTEMARALGKADASRPEDFLTALADLQKSCGVDDLKLTDYGINKEDLPDIRQCAYDTMGHMFAGDPVPVEPEDALAILERSYK